MAATVSAKDQLLHRLKAVAAGLGTLVAGYATVVITDPTLQGQVAAAAPPAYAWVVPVLFAAVVGGVVHAVPNKALPTTSTTSTPVGLRSSSSLEDDPS